MATISKSTSLDALRDRVSAALSDKFPSKSPTGDYISGPYIRDLFLTSVVYTYDGQLYTATYTTKDGVVTLGVSGKVEVAYKPLKESVQGVVLGKERTDVVMLEAKSYNENTGELDITVIKPGFNTSKTRFYPKAMLARDHGVFDGAKMFANHQTKDEAAKRPEGSIHDWVASMGKTYVEAGTGNVKAKAKIVDPPMKAKFDLLNQHGLLPQMGVSIRAWGGAQEAEVEGTKTTWVESMKGCKSVDFVTFPGAGGGVDGFAEAMEGFSLFDDTMAFQESQESEDIDLMSLSVLQSRRPDLVAQLTESITESIDMEKTTEELKAELAEAKRVNAEQATKIAESDKTARKAAVATALTTKLAEAKLPEVAAKRISEQFKESEAADGIDAAIAAEKQYLEAIGYKEPVTIDKGKKVVRGMGATSVDESTGKPAKGADDKDISESLVQEYMHTFDMKEADARNAVANL